MTKLKWAVLIVLPFILLYVSLFWGKYRVEPRTVARILASRVVAIEQNWQPTEETIVMRVRMPRVLLAMVIGAGLAISGAAYQGIFGNPLVSPDILGVTAASGVGASIALLLDWNTTAVQAASFTCGVLGVALAYAISRVYKTTPTLMLVLSGVVVGSLFSATTSAVKYIADPQSKLPTITFWLMGSLASVSWSHFWRGAPLILVGTAGLLVVRWRINLLALGDEEARSLGVRTERLRGFIIVCTTLISAATVCVAGVIGWIGLIIPHIARMIVGPDHKPMLPAAALLGASYLLLIDDAARNLTTLEIPLGILTAMIGTPIFAYLLRKTKGGWK